MSREVLGSALDDVDPGAASPDADPVPARPVPGSAPNLGAPRATPPAPPPREPATGGTSAAGSWVGERLDALRGSRRSTAAALVAVAVVAGLVAVGVVEQARQAGRDGAASVVAWLDPSEAVAEVRGTALLQLNVVNTGPDRVTVTAADLEGGLDGVPSGVALELADPVTVEPRGYVTGTVSARVERCGGPVPRGSSRDGDLRVTVAGADLRETVLGGARVGAFPVTSSSVVELACGAAAVPVVVVQSSMVRADGRLYVTLRGFSDDVEVDLAAPDGVRLVTEPEAPVTVAGGEDAPMTTIPVRLEVDTCTVAAQQLDAGNEVALEVDGERYGELDYLVVNAWVVREVASACG